jgi:uncharacterized Rmd1/YagE family protein
MESFRFIAFALGGELDLNKLSASLGIVRKFRWEEPMTLNPLTLQMQAEAGSGEPQVYLYFFGGVVFVNCDDRLIREFSRNLEKVTELFRGFPNLQYQEDYALRIQEDGTFAVANDYTVMPRSERAFIDIIASVIAKSVALERIEEQVDALLDEIEGMITLLGQGKLNIPDRRLAQLASKILNHKYRSIAYVMVLDKPEITWENQEADRLYLAMANQFEISLRYQEIKHKSETLMDITEVFSSLSHARRSSQLEWIIIILIFIEIVIYLLQIL